jgi:single-stranded DNA-binding protein
VPQVMEANTLQAQLLDRRAPDQTAEVVGRLQQRAWTAEDGSARSVVEVVAEELGPSLRWATATTTRATRSQSQ